MPEMDGFEATKEIRRQEVALGRHVPIIAVTALAMAGDRERCLAAGMDDYITKPIDKELLLEKLLYWTSPDRSARKHSKVVSIFENGTVFEHKDEPINIGQFEEAYGEEAHDLILLFISSTHKLIEELNQAVRDHDVTGIARLAHEIKGSSWAIGAEEMGRLALFLEQAAGQQNGKLIHRTYMRLVTHFHEVEKYVQDRLGAEVAT
jgi:two-component system, sensor histidine kinase and response regulator